MKKAVLVIDMPENCSKCKFQYEFQGMKKCNLLNALCGCGLISQNTFSSKRHEKCPFREMPEKEDNIKLAKSGDIYAVGIANGWNACIDAIGGTECKQ